MAHQAQQQELHKARTRYLEQACLRQEAEDLLHAIQCVLLEDAGDTDTGSGQADAKLQQAGLPVPAAAAQSLYKHLQAAFAVQRLQLPAAPQLPLHKGTAADATKSGVQDPDQLGSRHHVLGITPLQLRKTHMLSRKAAQKAHAPVLALLEQQLEQRAQQAVAAVAGPSAADCTVATHVCSMIQTKQHNVVQLQQDCTELLLSITQSYQAYMQDLSSMQHALLQLLQECILAEQPGSDKRHREYLEAHIAQMTNKLRVMHLQVRSSSYDAKNLAALQVIRQELQQTEQQLQDAVDAVAAQLREYAELGEEFHGMAQEYGAIKAKSASLEEMLDQLHAVENDCEAQPYY